MNPSSLSSLKSFLSLLHFIFYLFQVPLKINIQEEKKEEIQILGRVKINIQEEKKEEIQILGRGYQKKKHSYIQ